MLGLVRLALLHLLLPKPDALLVFYLPIWKLCFNSSDWPAVLFIFLFPFIALSWLFRKLISVLPSLSGPLENSYLFYWPGLTCWKTLISFADLVVGKLVTHLPGLGLMQTSCQNARNCKGFVKLKIMILMKQNEITFIGGLINI